MIRVWRGGGGGVELLLDFGEVSEVSDFFLDGVTYDVSGVVSIGRWW